MSIQENLENIRHRIETIDGSVHLLAVSKTFGIEAIEQAIEAGQRSFGENYVQEGVKKIQYFQKKSAFELEWHFIGPLQSNKTRLVAENFDWVQSVDRSKIAHRLSEQRPDGKEPLNVLIEVNIDDESSKSGVKPEDVRALADIIVSLPNLRLRGLMAIPAPKQSSETSRQSLRAMKTLFEELKAEGYPMDVLSMGMSADMVEAIEEGATMVRIGSAIFGERNYG